ncbi:MAG TPA: glycosyltransferase [Solirubrobacteraceae bacterium]|nr:glycosyltransferase [Solirubrobacteraceae bacterium]
MTLNELPNTPRADQSRSASVLIAASGEPEASRECLAAVRAHGGPSVAVVEVAPDASSVNRAAEQLAPADVVLLSEPCRVAADWIERLRRAAYSDTNVATASALAVAGTPLALDERASGEDRGKASGERELTAITSSAVERSRRLRPRLSRAVGPCVYIRRDALELVGPLDEQLDLRAAVEGDFAQRCVLSGLTHVAADDVVVQPLAEGAGAADDAELALPLRERYPYLAETPLADSSVLAYALQSVREPPARLPVTLDARALDGAITGTHVHIFELILALARTEELELRLLIRAELVDPAARDLLAALGHTELLDAEELDPRTARTAVFHRPQQTFSPSDVALGLALGERFVLSQLDLIAYRNPGYFRDAARWRDYRAASRHGLSAAERVVVFSEHTRRELLADALVEQARLSVVPPGLDHRAAGEPRRPAALSDHVLDTGFLLCLGTDFRHKNRVFALRLLAELRARHGWRGALVLAGTHIPQGSSAELERAFLESRGELAGAVVSLGPVDEPEKAWLIDASSAIVYPSVYEGFGLVPFESALSGVPCIFAPQASLAEEPPEGTATIVPWDPVASAANAYALLSDAARREAHVRTLADRARGFTWAAAASAMVEIYREAAAAPVRDSATLSRDLVKREARLSIQHEEEVAQLVGEREHAQRMYDALNAEVGFGLSLIGPHGALPETVQRALLALSARPALSRPLFAAVASVFAVMRAFSRPIRMLLRRPR